MGGTAFTGTVVGKLQPPGFGGEQLTTHNWRYFWSVNMPEEEVQRHRELRDALLAAESELRSADWAVEDAMRDVASAHGAVER